MIELNFEDKEVLTNIKRWLNQNEYSHTQGEYYQIWNLNTQMYELYLNPKTGNSEHLETLIRLKFL